MAESLIDSMAADFDPAQYHDEYREALQQVVDAKVEGREVVEPQPEAVAEGGGVVDLMAALRESVAAAKRSRGEEPAAEPAPSARPAAKAPAKAAKAPAKKAAAKKAPAKKAVAGRDGAAKTAAVARKAPAKKAAKKAASRRSA